MNTKCPFQPKKGYVDARSEYLFHFHGVTAIGNESDGGINEKLPSKSLFGSVDTNDRLYFWQLYSLIADKPILDIVTDFYNRVYDDEDNPWFRDAFTTLAPKMHHIYAQSAYWVDAFGGGKLYHGGNYRLTFHHSVNAQEVMTARGAKRWMHHMSNVLKDANKQKPFAGDPRFMRCIVEFLETKMRTYAKEHEWIFDKDDFDALKTDLGIEVHVTDR